MVIDASHVNFKLSENQLDENLFSRFAFKLYLIRVFAFAWVVFTCMSRLMPESFSSAPKKWLTHESFVQAFFINLSHSSRLSICLSHFPDNKWRARNPVRQIFYAWVVLPESFAQPESFYLSHLLTVSHFTWIICSPWVTLPESFAHHESLYLNYGHGWLTLLMRIFNFGKITWSLLKYKLYQQRNWHKKKMDVVFLIQIH